MVKKLHVRQRSSDIRLSKTSIVLTWRYFHPFCLVTKVNTGSLRTAYYLTHSSKKTFEDSQVVIRNRKLEESKKIPRTLQYPKEEEHKDKQSSSKHCVENKRQNSTKPNGSELWCFGRIFTSCSTSTKSLLNVQDTVVVYLHTRLIHNNTLCVAYTCHKY